MGWVSRRNPQRWSVNCGLIPNNIRHACEAQEANAQTHTTLHLVLGQPRRSRRLNTGRLDPGGWHACLHAGMLACWHAGMLASWHLASGICHLPPGSRPWWRPVSGVLFKIKNRKKEEEEEEAVALFYKSGLTHYVLT